MKKNVLQFVLLCFLYQMKTPVIAIAQSIPDKDWDYTFGGNLYDTLSVLKQTTDGGFVLGGRSKSGITGNKTQDTKGGLDFWIVKLNYSGVKQWDVDLGGNGNDVLSSVCETSSYNLVFGGYSNSGISGDKSQDNRGKYDFWIVKTSPSGIKIWDKRFGGSGNDILSEIRQTNDGGFILGGYSDSGADGDKSQAGQGANDFWIVKTDSNGIKLWDVRFGGCSDDNLFTILQTADGGYLLGGLTHSLITCGGDIEQAGYGGKDYWIIKTDASGNKLWTNRFGGDDRDILHSVIETSTGYLLAGTSASNIFGDQTNSKRGSDDYWLIYTDLNGAKIWDKRYGGNKADILNDFQKMSDGYILGGYSSSNVGGEKTHNPIGAKDYWLVKVDLNGNILWDKTVGGFENDELVSAQQGFDCGLILGGTSNSGVSGDKSETSFGYTDYWCVKLKADPPKYYFADLDADGYGDLHDSVSSCSPIAGLILVAGDCNDADNKIHTGAAETCNGLDDNCNGIIDDNASAPILTGIISGAAIGTCKDTITYTITPVNGTIGYTWAVPSTVTILYGQGTTSLDVSFPANFISDTIKVYGYNDCGGGNVLKLNVTGKPAKPTKITGPGSVCANQQNISYSITPVFGATSYTWTPPSGVVITSGQGTINVKVNWGTTNGDLKVKSVNSCGSSATLKKTIKVTCKLSQHDDISVNVYPDPVSAQCNLEFYLNEESNITLRLFDMLGNEVFTRNDGFRINEYASSIDMNNFSNGIYLLEIAAGNKIIQKQIIKQ